jgi:hypothetical protein
LQDAALSVFFIDMFFLTRREQLLAAFVLTAFLIGLGAHHWRMQRGLEPLTVAEAGE